MRGASVGWLRLCGILHKKHQLRTMKAGRKAAGKSLSCFVCGFSDVALMSACFPVRVTVLATAATASNACQCSSAYFAGAKRIILVPYAACAEP